MCQTREGWGGVGALVGSKVIFYDKILATNLTGSPQTFNLLIAKLLHFFVKNVVEISDSGLIL